MVDLEPPLRRARLDDAATLAQLIDLAGEGMPGHLWAEMAQAGETALDVGTQRTAREEGGFSYRHTVVAEIDRAVAGMLIGYRQPDPYDTRDMAAVPDIVRPLVELEAEAPGTWYINALAVFPSHQGQGIGSRLLALADALAADAGARTLSLIVAGENTGAFRLYGRSGFRPAAVRPIVAFPGTVHRGDWILMTKEL